MRRKLLVCFFTLLASILAFSAGSGALLLQNPTLSKTQIAFAYGGDIRIVSRVGRTPAPAWARRPPEGGRAGALFLQVLGFIN